MAPVVGGYLLLLWVAHVWLFLAPVMGGYLWLLSWGLMDPVMGGYLWLLSRVAISGSRHGCLFIAPVVGGGLLSWVAIYGSCRG